MGEVSLGIVGERTSQSLQLLLLFIFSLPLLEDSAVKPLLAFVGLLFFTEVEKDWKFFFPHAFILALILVWQCLALGLFSCITKYNRIIEQSRLEGTSKDHLVQMGKGA